MCLLVLAWRAHPRYRLIFAGNRDEFHDRPAAPMAWWDDHPDVLGGRDLQAGGTWLAVSRTRRFGVVTNYRDMQRPLPAAPSRGSLITAFLTSARDAAGFAKNLESHAGDYAGFNLLLADEHSLLYASNRAPEFARALTDGVHGLSNHLLDTPWPKLRITRARFEAQLGAARQSFDALFEMLADRTPAADHDLPSTGLSPEWERMLSAPFIVNERYGTRCSTVVLLGHDGALEIRERRFEPDGRMSGESRFELPPA